MTTQSITVTLNSKPTFETVRMRAEDTARKLLVTIVDTNSQPLDLTNLTVEFRAKRPDGTEITYTEQVEIQDSVILIGPTPLQKAIAVPGIVLCELLLYGIAGYIGTATWQINAWLPAVRNEGQQSTSDFQSAVEAAVIAVAAAERAETAANDVVQYSSHPAEIRDGYWWTWNTTTGAMENSGQLAQGADGRILEIVPGDNIDVDDTDPARPIVASTGGGGTGDMLKSDYDPNDVVSAAGGIPNVAFDTYTHSSSGTVHFLSGGTGPNIKFIATADYVAGDTFEVNGAACAAQAINGLPLPDGYFVAGANVTCVLSGTTLFFEANSEKWKKIQATHASFSDPLNAFYWNAATKTLWPRLYSALNAVANQAIITTLPVDVPRPSAAYSADLYTGTGYTSATITTTSVSIPASLTIDTDGVVRMSLSVPTTLYRVAFFTPLKLWYALDDQIT